MSRVGQKPVVIPDGVTMSVDGQTVSVKGPKGELSYKAHHTVSVAVDDGTVTTARKKGNNSKTAQALWGTTARLIENMITGVTDGYEKKLELEGVGFRMAMKGNQIDLALGFSHPVLVDVPEKLTAAVDGMTLVISGADKQQVGQFAAEVRGLKPVEPYKGKGFRYDDEIVRRKEGKKAVAAA